MEQHRYKTQIQPCKIDLCHINGGLSPIAVSPIAAIASIALSPIAFRTSRTFVVAVFFLISLISCDQYSPPPDWMVEKVTATNWLDDVDNSGRTCWLNDMTNREREECYWVESFLLPPIDKDNRQHFGQQYDPHKYYRCNMRKDRSGHCRKYKMRRIERPPVWPYPDVPAIQWPKAPEKETYKRGMSSKDYFNALCEAEAGKFIYRTVDNVEGIYQVRPRVVQQDDYRLEDRYLIEDPAFQTTAENENRDSGSWYLINGARGGKGQYSFWETSLYERNWSSWDLKYHHPSMLDESSANARFIRYSSAIGKDYDPSRSHNITKQYIAQLKSRYGYVWRGIQRPHDRKLSIAGGEIAIIDLQTNEILALWRSFARTGQKDRNIWWLSPETCHKKTGTFQEMYQFISEVLKPANNNTIQGEN